VTPNGQLAAIACHKSTCATFLRPLVAQGLKTVLPTDGDGGFAVQKCRFANITRPWQGSAGCLTLAATRRAAPPDSVRSIAHSAATGASACPLEPRRQFGRRILTSAQPLLRPRNRSKTLSRPPLTLWLWRRRARRDRAWSERRTISGRPQRRRRVNPPPEL
jgi:hypothetical protein